MEEISLALKTSRNDRDRANSSYDLTREPFIAEMVERVKNGEDVFVKFPKKDRKRPGAIAKVRKVEGAAPCAQAGPVTYRRSGVSDYKVHLKWDGRKNTATVNLNDGMYSTQLTYLRGYTGKTVWSMFDAKEHAKKYAKPILDRLGREIKAGDTVVFINARYGSGAELDFGTVQEIKHTASKNYRGGTDIESAVIIETIAVGDNESVMHSKIKKANKSIMIITNVDLLGEAFIAKLSVNQVKQY